MKKTLVARNIVQRLYAAENAVDGSIAEMSRLMATMVETRQELGLPATLGAEALEKISEALAALNQARAATVAGHHELARVGDELGIPTVATPHVPKVVAARVIEGGAERRAG